MDAFFAAVHTLDHPEYATVPIAVGGISMISTANYEARKFGVRSAMPGFIARRLCPHLIFVPSDFAKYKHCAEVTREVFRQYDPHFDAGSLDEAYLVGRCTFTLSKPVLKAQRLWFHCLKLQYDKLLSTSAFT